MLQKTHQQDVEMQLQVDAELAKRLSENDREPQVRLML